MDVPTDADYSSEEALTSYGECAVGQGLQRRTVCFSVCPAMVLPKSMGSIVDVRSGELDALHGGGLLCVQPS